MTSPHHLQIHHIILLSFRKISLLPPHVSSNPPKIQICPHKIFRKTFSKYSQFSESIFQSKLECFIFSKSETRLLETKTRTLETKTLVSSSYSITQNLCSSSSHRKLFFLSRAKTLILQSDQNPSLKILK
jgi:hypothetical protein